MACHYRSTDFSATFVQLVLYQGSQVVLGQVTVSVVKAWTRRLAAKNDRILKQGASSILSEDRETTVARPSESEAEIDGTPGENGVERGLERGVDKLVGAEEKSSGARLD